MVKESHEGKSWIHTLYFNAFFEEALAKIRAETGLGETYAIFNSLNEYWYEQGYMSEEGHRYNREKYGLGIVEDFKQKILKTEIKKADKEKTHEEQQIEKTLTTIFNNWDEAPPKSQKYALTRAREYPQFPISKLILERESHV